jgi:hypothetical protein
MTDEEVAAPPAGERETHAPERSSFVTARVEACWNTEGALP